MVAVVAADVWLNTINDYIVEKSTKDNFLCVVNDKGQMIFSPKEEGVFKVDATPDAPDLRNYEDKDFADFIMLALQENTGLKALEIDGEEYYICGVPMDTLGWAVISVVDKELTNQPTASLLESYNAINDSAAQTYRNGVKYSSRVVIVFTVIVVLLDNAAALILAHNIVKPLETMTRKINSISDSNQTFTMEKVYKTGDEVEVLAESFATLSERMHDYITQITHITAEKERIGTELALATRIQADMLPNIYPAFPDRPEFDIYASMDPAKEVGGDFYDFFLADDDHLCMVMADVSGKGVPAALFMMASKIILQNNAMMGKSPAQILKDTNAAICANNREDMFVTVWMGVLEISSGKLTAANAGHEYPMIKRKDGEFGLVKDKHGFVIGGIENLKFKEYETILRPGDKLFLYTDGVPEATNPQNELFGTERMIASLNQISDSAPEKILKQMRKAVDDFVEESEQFDDITMLCLEYNGTPQDRKEE
ncbi:MAG: SpoIIE family protein phosphatase [Saccharofermentans sp.]|nr:SpoIIE family protein phosphatase [Saccharofermentans sp.]